MIIAIDARNLEVDGGGINRYILELLSFLKNKHKLICLSTKPISNLPSGIENVVIPQKFHWLVWEQVQLPLKLLKIKPDFYHATSNWGVPLCCPVPSVATIHDLIPLSLPDYFINSNFPFISKLLYFMRLKIALSISRNVICTTRELKMEIVNKFKIDMYKVTVIPMGISRKFFLNGNIVDNNLLKKSGIEEPYILSHGGLDRRKNNDLIIKAFSLLISNSKYKFKEISLVITGENEAVAAHLKSIAKTFKIQDKVKFVGFVSEDEMVSLIRNCSLDVYVTQAEGFGFPLLEALACKKPVVASEIDILTNHGKSVPIFVKSSNIHSIMNGMIKGLKPISQSRLEFGMSLARKYTWDKTMEETLKIYKKYY